MHIEVWHAELFLSVHAALHVGVDEARVRGDVQRPHGLREMPGKAPEHPELRGIRVDVHQVPVARTAVVLQHQQQVLGRHHEVFHQPHVAPVGRQVAGDLLFKQLAIELQGLHQQQVAAGARIGQPEEGPGGAERPDAVAARTHLKSERDLELLEEIYK